MPRLHGKPEVAEGIGELAALASLNLVKSLAPPDDECAGMPPVGTEQLRNVLREFLSLPPVNSLKKSI